MHPTPHPPRLLWVLAFVAVRSVIFAAIIAAVVAWVTSIGFWPVFGLAAIVLLARGGVRWLKTVRDFRSHLRSPMARRIDDDDSEGGDVREPRRPVGPRPDLRGSADPDESTGPTAIP
jgi:hypothetical protein